jgi:hypothetical protein
MKTNNVFGKLACLFVFSALVACSEDAIVENIDGNGILQRVSITGKDFQFDDATRSSVSITENGASFLWDEDDVIGIFPNEGDQVSFAMSQGAGTQTATFSGGGWALKSSATYAAYYPHVYENRDMTKIPVSYVGQTQNGNNNTDHIGAYDFMAASVATPSNGAVAFDMQHLGCLVQLKIDLLEEAGIGNVSIKYGSSYNYGYTAPGDICPTGWTLPTSGGTNKDFAMLYTNLSSTPANIRKYPNNFLYSGIIYDSRVNDRGSDGSYWSKTASQIELVYVLHFGKTYVSPSSNGDNGKNFGLAIRCLAQ